MIYANHVLLKEMTRAKVIVCHLQLEGGCESEASLATEQDCLKAKLKQPSLL